MAAMAKKLKKVKVPVFDAQAFLDSASVTRRVKTFERAEIVYSQGDTAKSVMYSSEICLISSFESTNRSGQVSGTSDASKTQSGLIRN
jgi:CRP-like cAMP-binding protein